MVKMILTTSRNRKTHAVRLLLTGVIALCFSVSAFAQLSGSYTIGAGQTYTTISAFVNALNTSGVSGPVVATVQPGTYAGPITINAITGASSTNTITIQGSNVNTCIVEATTNSTGSFVIQLYGTDYLRLRNLTVNANGTYGFGISLTSQADYNEITGCHVNCTPNSSSSYCVPIIGSSGSATTYANHANNNLVQNNVVYGGYYGIRFNGSSSTTNCTGNQFIGNTVTGFYYSGIHAYYQAQVVISENTCIDGGAYSSANGLYVYYCRQAPVITRNYTRTQYRGLYCYYGNQDHISYGEISNNMLITYGSGANYGLYVYYNYKMNVWNNSVNFMTASGTAYGIYIYNYSTSAHDVRNNVIRYNGTGTCYFVYGAQGSTAGYFTNFSHNVFYHASSSYDFYWASTYYYDLASVISATGLLGNTLTVDPQYVSNYDLHTYSSALSNSGSGITSLAVDFDGDTRSTTTPDRGCDEYVLYSVDVGASELVSPSGSCGHTATSPLVVKIRNYGTATLNASTNPVTVNVTVTGPVNQNFSATLSSGTIASGSSTNFTVTNNLNMATPGTYSFTATANATGDGNSNNAAMPPTDIVAEAGISTFPYITDLEANNGGWVHYSIGGADDWEWGDPTYSGYANANSGTNCWATKLSSAYSSSSAAVLASPCLNFSTLTSPVLTFYMAYDAEDSYDGLIVEGSGDGGGSWTKLTPVTPAYTFTGTAYGPLTEPYYSGTYSSFSKHVFALGAYALNSTVKVRFRFESDGSVQYAGFLIDDISIGNFYQKDISVAKVVYNNAQNYWARRINNDHTIDVLVKNEGYETNPSSVTLTYKVGSMPANVGDGVSQTFTPSWSGGEAWVSFTAPHVPTATGAVAVYVKAFYTGDQGSANDVLSVMPVIQNIKTYGYEDFDILTPPEWEVGWKVQDNNSGETWEMTSGNGVSGTNCATYPGDVTTADDWLISPSAYLGAGASYSLKFKYRSRTGTSQKLEVAWGPNPDPSTMTVFATFNGFTNTTFTDALGTEGVAPYFNTPNTAQGYYIAFHVTSGANAGAVDIDDVTLIENPTPPPKIAYGIDPNWIDDPAVPIVFSGVYKKSGLLTHTYTVVNATGKYGVPEGDMLWDVYSPTSWLTITKSTPDPLTYLASNPFNPAWCRQFQTFTMDVDPSNLSPGSFTGSLTLDAYLYNVDYVNGIRASNAPFTIPVVVNISAAGGVSQNPSATMTHTGLTAAGNPWTFSDGQGNIYASVNITNGTIPTMTITSYPGQLPGHISKYRYVYHYWVIDAPGTGWTADVDFMYFDSEVQAGGVFNENILQAMRIAPKTTFWENPIAGTHSTADGLANTVHVTKINPSNYAGEIAVAHGWNVEERDDKISANIPNEFVLDQNFPNPFNPSTSIRFGIPEETYVTLTVLNSLGEEVAKLVDTRLSAGYHTVQFDASKLGSGVYIYMLKAGTVSHTKTMILNK